MTEQNEEVKKSDGQGIKQARMTLPFLSDEVPVLYLAGWPVNPNIKRVSR